MAIDHSAQASGKRSRLLAQVKGQSEPGAMRPRLCFLIAEDGRAVTPPQLKWEFYAGMGNTDLATPAPDDQKAAHELLESGQLVPAQADMMSPWHKIRLLKHFDDVCWGRLPDNELVMYELRDYAQQDTLIKPDATHAAAVAWLDKRIQYGGTMTDTPLAVRTATGPVIVTPILTDKTLIAIRQRQKQGTPAP